MDEELPAPPTALRLRPDQEHEFAASSHLRGPLLLSAVLGAGTVDVMDGPPWEETSECVCSFDAATIAPGGVWVDVDAFLVGSAGTRVSVRLPEPLVLEVLPDEPEDDRAVATMQRILERLGATVHLDDDGLDDDAAFRVEVPFSSFDRVMQFLAKADVTWFDVTEDRPAPSPHERALLGPDQVAVTWNPALAGSFVMGWATRPDLALPDAMKRILRTTDIVLSRSEAIALRQFVRDNFDGQEPFVYRPPLD